MEEDFQITVAKQTGKSVMPSYHYHDYYEIYYLAAGERIYYIEDRSYPVKKGSMLFINKNNIHKTVDGGKPGHERILIYFTDQFLERHNERDKDYVLSTFRDPSKLVHFNSQEQSFIENLLFQMVKEYKKGSRKGNQLYLEALLVQMLVYAARKMEQSTKEELSTVGKKITEVVAYCNTNYTHNITLKEISNRFYISPYYFSRIFKQHTGFNFKEYLHLLRIREAQRLLKETDLKIIEIAEKIGYINITHFNRKFKLITRTSPKEYRKMVEHAQSVMEVNRIMKSQQG